MWTRHLTDAVRSHLQCVGVQSQPIWNVRVPAVKNKLWKIKTPSFCSRSLPVHILCMLLTLLAQQHHIIVPVIVFHTHGQTGSGIENSIYLLDVCKVDERKEKETELFICYQQS